MGVVVEKQAMQVTEHMNMFTEFDVIVCVIIMLTTIISLLRGALKDVFSLLSYIVAAVVTLSFYPYAA